MTDPRSASVLDSPTVVDWLWPLETLTQRRRVGLKRVGGKAWSLAQLAREGYPVPRGWALDARCFTRHIVEHLPPGHDLATVVKLAGTRAGVDRAARARDWILAAPLPSGLLDAIDALWTAIEPEAPWGLATRSSATCEDTEATSLAGLAETVLGARGPDAIAAAIRKVWASAYLLRSIAYLAHAGLRDMAMGVVLQLMVPAEAAGVLFTAPPPGMEGDGWPADERLINATFGLGAPVVEGSAPVDTFRIARHGGAVVASAITQKRRALRLRDGALVDEEIPAARTSLPSLDADALRELAAIADRLDKSEGGPFDVEFALEAETHRVWLLQVRPLRGGGFPEGGDADTIWSRANVGEALPGAATPLTWSVARAFSDHGFREAFAALGCRVPRGATLVANIQGRFYLNLTTFMQIAAQVPGLSPAAILGVSGGAGPAVIQRLTRQAAHVSWRSFLVRLPLTAPRLLVQQAALERDVSLYETDAGRARRSLAEMDLRLLPDDGLATTLKSAFGLLERTGTLMLRCASASLASYLALCEALRRLAPGRASARSPDADDPTRDPLDEPPAGEVERLAQTLIGGAQEVESAAPGVDLARIGTIALREAAARDRLLSGDVRTPDDLPDGPTREALRAFLERYGDRAVREAELSTPRWSEDPQPILAMLTASMRSPEGESDRALARARALSDREMALLEARLGRAQIALVRALVWRAQHTTRLRERMRGWVTRVLGMLRTVALDIDRRLRRLDPSLDEGSVFFCTYDELCISLGSGRADVGSVVRLRRAEHARDAARPDPPPTFVGRPPPVTLPPAAGTRLYGLPASGGVVEGRARVLEPGTASLDALKPGEVLVSRTTDVGLSPLFLIAAAVVTELGGPLSHASIVAREYGVPAVVNVPGVSLAIRTGDRLRVDGDRGIVERLEERTSIAPPPPPPSHTS
ncbi:PEP/pyruvate-binding domain-containing protein [Chondromyces apiculatus]|uniref:Phosphoenolpyruvate synthase n=1 Tax=Chondromyces apiculatus DSM 436 TaxID=1192034 RepID=A0A017STT9_9BACT|nr:PEP/pyruvate-binding domain-containing protein [Chondromyces apiculatus]EYF00384.1 Phosphoenolpyruvate synthase [Chondromyces apiculatus DSM 436]